MVTRHQYAKIAVVVLVIVAVFGFGFSYYLDSLSGGYNMYAIFPNGEKVKILDVLKTNEERARGLSGRTALGADEGMYFSFPEEDSYGFWMKDMNFPIDILWVSKGTLVGFAENAAPQPGVPDSSLTVYTPPQAIGGVLEMTAGAKQRYNLNVGDKIQIRIISKK
jgi:hypothetical protein